MGKILLDRKKVRNKNTRMATWQPMQTQLWMQTHTNWNKQMWAQWTRSWRWLQGQKKTTWQHRNTCITYWYKEVHNVNFFETAKLVFSFDVVKAGLSRRNKISTDLDIFIQQNQIFAHIISDRNQKDNHISYVFLNFQMPEKKAPSCLAWLTWQTENFCKSEVFWGFWKFEGSAVKSLWLRGFVHILQSRRGTKTRHVS